jgi:uncharacterized protein YacL
MPSPFLIKVISISLIIGALLCLIIGGVEWYRCDTDTNINKDNCDTYIYLTIGGSVGLIIGSILAFLNYEGRFDTTTVEISNRLTSVVPPNPTSNINSV